jgi:lipoyl(octanoyl) transferase
MWRPAVGAQIDWDRFGEDFSAGLARALRCDAKRTAWPNLNEEELGGLVEQYASAEWLEQR